jgi:hypothetical protein
MFNKKKRLKHCKASSVGLGHLSGHKCLRELELCGTDCQDQSLEDLQSIPNLRYLGLRINSYVIFHS